MPSGGGHGIIDASLLGWIISVIEQLMYFAIGALGMGLFGAFFLPAYRRRAVRLARHHLQLQMPMSMAEVTARLDAVRAEAAAAQRAAEQQAERASLALAEHQAQLGHQRNQLLETQQALRALQAEHAVATQALASAHAQVVELAAIQGATSQALYNTDAIATAQRIALLEADQLREHLEALGQSDRMTIASLSTRIEGDSLTIGDLRRALTDSAAQLDGALTVSANLRQARDDMQTALRRQVEAVQHLQGRHETLLGRHQQVEATLAQARDTSAALEREVETWKVRCRELEASLERAKSEDTRRVAQSLGKTEAMAERLAQYENDLRTLRNDNAMLQGRIDTLQDDRRTRSAAMKPPTAGPSAADLASLRQTIRALGDEVAAMASKDRGADSPADDEAQRQAPDKLVQLQTRVVRSAAAS